MFLFTDRIEPAAAPQKGGALGPALKDASARTGTSFDFLLQTATRESGLRPDAKARTSSATGLFQFVEQTWLSVLRTEGAQQGLAREASQIAATGQGRLQVSDAAERTRILDLRKDPEISARMAGVLAAKNRDGLKAALGRDPTQGELYVAHFLGLSGATALIRLKDRAPDAVAATQLPEAAPANRAIFHERSGQARSVSQVYARLVAGFDTAQTAVSAPISPSVAQKKPFYGLFNADENGPPAAALQVRPTASPRSQDAARAGAIGKPLDLLAFSRVRSRPS